MRICLDNDNQLLIVSPAKLNLFLELHHRRADGFHELETIMTQFGIFDYLYFCSESHESIELQVQKHPRLSRHHIPSDENNLIVKSLRIMRDLAGRKFGATIKLYKNIPVQAGMGGASSNAAAAMMAANWKWQLGFSTRQLTEIAAQVGSDVAFFLGDSLSRCTGKGEKVQKISSRCRLNIVVVQPISGMSTAEIYSRCEVPKNPLPSNKILQGLCSGDARAVGKYLFNRLERFAEDVSDDVNRIRSEFQRTACLGHQLTGSGSCYFGLYPNKKTMRVAARILANRLPMMKVLTGQTLV